MFLELVIVIHAERSRVLGAGVRRALTRSVIVI